MDIETLYANLLEALTDEKIALLGYNKKQRELGGELDSRARYLAITITLLEQSWAMFYTFVIGTDD